MGKTKSLLGPAFRRIQPKLRMIANGNQKVNELRANSCSSIRVKSDKSLLQIPDIVTMSQTQKPHPQKVKTLRAVTDKTEANVFIQYVNPDKIQKKTAELLTKQIKATDIEQNTLSTAIVSLDRLKDIASDDSVAYIELGEPLKVPTPIICSESSTGPSKTLRSFDARGGEGVLVGIIDVQGFDFAHDDFLDPVSGGTRFEAIWDQGGTTRASPAKFEYGSELLKEHMNESIDKAQDFGIAPQLLEPQSQMATGSHGTHVASIAAGNRGICRKAFLAGVLVSLPSEDMDRRKSFYDSTRLAHAVDYLIDLAEQLKGKYNLEKLPISINVSLGTNGHAHDGSSAVSRWIDSALTIPGRSICVAAGNAGQEKPESEGDWGYVMGRIHTSGRIAARGLDTDIDWIVVGNGISDFSENELEIWYSPSDRFAISIFPPGMEEIGPIHPGQFIENRQLPDSSFLSVYNELYHPANGSNYIGVYLSPFYGDHPIGITPGQWKIRLHGIEVRDGDFHAWIERDDPRRLGMIGTQQAWAFPSFFSEQSNVDNSSISSLACGHRVISVGNLDEKDNKINISSSQGPTRDERYKPDVVAPGTDIIAAKGFSYDDGNPWISMSGTSMASPYATGVVGLMLATNPDLTAAQIGGIIQRTSRPLPGFDYMWKNDMGYGVISPDECIKETKKVNKREDLT